MKRVKLDENFPPSFTNFFTAENIDASSVLQQNISGAEDDKLFNICKIEERIIVTFDLDFANILRYPANDTEGIIVCRIKKQVSLNDIHLITKKVIRLIKTQEITGRLYVIDGERIRVRKPDE